MEKNKRKAEPLHIRKLLDLFSRQDTADLLGITTSGLSSILTRNEVTATIELAAMYWLQQHRCRNQGTKSYLIIVPFEKKELVSSFLSAAEIKTTPIEGLIE